MIKIKNASENNLKNISINIPKHKITTLTGVSGSGKSSLIYNVLAREAQRRQRIDSGNAHCIDYAVRPKFERIENLPYCINLKQRGISESISSTLATAAGIHELLRSELSQYGEIIGNHGNIITEPSVDDIKVFIQRYYPKTSFQFFAIVCDEEYTDGQKELELLRKSKISTAIFISSYDQKERVKAIRSIKGLNSQYQHTILVSFNKMEDLEKYAPLAKENFRLKSDELDLKLSIDFFDIETGKLYQKKSTQLLSFNSSSKFSGKCNSCAGHGVLDVIDLENLIIKDKLLGENFLNLATNEKGGYKYISIYRDTLDKVIKKAGIDKNKTFWELSSPEKDVITGLIFPKIIKHQARPTIGKFLKPMVCKACDGTRLNYKANAVKLYDLNISEMLKKTVDDLYDFLCDKALHHKKILNILFSLKQATLGYLPLERTTDTLSGGELQRLKFSLELTSEYNDLLYILDEPSSGLHPYNNMQMINLIKQLKNKGNTIVISEHNQDYIQNSDYLIELGIGSGAQGGDVVYSGKPKSVDRAGFIRTKKRVDLNNTIELLSVHANNIKNENFIVPMNCLVSITGVSGSGKSSLIHKVLSPNVKQYLQDESICKETVKEIRNIGKIKAIVELTQSQIGINSRSIVATYLNVFDELRNIFSNVDLSKKFNFDKGYFSFNSFGACEVCKGLGELETNICPSCLGKRYKPEILGITFKGLSISDVLQKPISDLDSYFDNPKLNFALNVMHRLGLSHLSLGRQTPSLSGGEAQRVKLAQVLISSHRKINEGGALFIMDEPTTGLNVKDTAKLYAIIDELIALNNSVIIIEHNLEIIKNSDYIIDIGLGSGDAGGKNIFRGSYENLIKHKTSLTAKAFNGIYEDVKYIDSDSSQLKPKIFNGRKTPNCNKFYLDEKHFKIEREFYKGYNVVTDNDHHIYFKDKYELFDFIEKLNCYKVFFNPYVSDLFKYKVVPISIKKDKLTKMKRLGFKIGTQDYHEGEWEYRIEANDVENAYNFGNGWVTVVAEGRTYECFTRLVSIENKVIGVPEVNEYTFNLYLNSCAYCKGSGVKQSYEKNLIIKDGNKSILDDGFLWFPLRLQLKGVITRFLKEGLFDFTLPFNQLSKDEQSIFLYGFEEYKFLKPNGKPTTLSDYIQWKGLFSLIYENLNRIEMADNIRASKKECICPFCQKGFAPDVAFYHLNNMNIIHYLG